MDLYTITGREDVAAAALARQEKSWRRRGTTFLTSVALHAAALAGIAYWPVYGSLFLPERQRPPRELARQQRRVLIYYPPAVTEPKPQQQQQRIDVSPRAAERITSPRVNIRTPEPVSIRTEAERRTWNRDQFIRAPVPKIAMQPPVPSPSSVIVQAAPAPPPPLPAASSPSAAAAAGVPPPPSASASTQIPALVSPVRPAAARTFVPPPVQTRTQPPATREGLAAMAEAPKPLGALTPAAGERVPNVATRREFLPPPPPGAKPVKREMGAIEDPKALAVTAGAPAPRVVSGAKQLMPPPPPGVKAVKREIGAVEAAPSVVASGLSGAAPVVAGAKQLMPPPPPGVKADRRGVAGGSGIQVDAPPPTAVGAQGMPGPQTMVVLTTNPTPGAPPPQPQGNRDARITVGGEAAPGTVVSRRPAGGFVAPGAVVRGAVAGIEPGVGGPPPGVGSDGVKAAPAIPGGPAVPRPQFNSTAAVSAPLRPGARQVNAEVEKMFAGRVVYSTVVPSVAGQPDWVLWFGDPAGASGGGRVFSMRPPIPERATLPRVLPGMQGKMWIPARLTRDGTLTGISGVGPELAAALGKWVFYPAIRNGQAAEVDVLIEAGWRP